MHRHEVSDPGQVDEGYLMKDKPASRHFVDVAPGNIQGPGKITPLFQKLARESDQLGEVQKKEEQKIENYRKISATLNNITASAENLVAPQLARSVLTQADCKSLIRKNNEDCQKIWKEAISIFSEETTRAIDQHLQLALLSIKDEVGRGISIITGATNKRKRDDVDGITDPQPRDKIDTSSVRGIEASQNVENGTSHIIKRQRLRAPSLSISQQQQQQQDIGNVDSEQIALIKQLKLKIEQQEKNLVILAKENKEVSCDSEGSEENEALTVTNIG
ncbi:hypothetical protein CVT25_015642 [Psilocybe cyanescens]|uniref:Uncharacterized protein n=1 Tax=Psilocybe cyanescens TaxID=93625 RepID=A0A409WHU0_PSICY|nr:hypothetical protein CVT25_015642 [Psilocybe cyanescens]